MIYLSGVKNYLNDQTMSVEYAVEAKLYPEHLFVSDLNCFRTDDNPHFVGVVRIECFKRTDDEVGNKEPPKRRPDVFGLCVVHVPEIIPRDGPPFIRKKWFSPNNQSMLV